MGQSPFVLILDTGLHDTTARTSAPARAAARNPKEWAGH